MGAHEFTMAHQLTGLGFESTIPAGLDDDLGHPMAQVVADLGSEVAAPLTTALERLAQVRLSGRMDAATLAALHDDILRARQSGIVGQQVARLARGHLRQSAERLDLARALRAAVAQREATIGALGIELRQTLQSLEVLADAALAYSLLQAMVDWSLEHAQQRVEFVIDQRSWPVRARLICRFAFRPADQADTIAGGLDPHQHSRRSLDSMTWHLIEQTALALELPLERQDEHGRAQLTIEFPRQVREPIDGVSVIELDTGSAPLEPESRSLAGSHVLVIAARRDTRALVRDAVRPLGLLLDFVGTLDEAREFGDGGLPHAIVYEAALGGERLDEWRRSVQRSEPGIGFIAIGEQGRGYEVVSRGGQALATVGREGIGQHLGNALAFELSRGG